MPKTKQITKILFSGMPNCFFGKVKNSAFGLQSTASSQYKKIPFIPVCSFFSSLFFTEINPSHFRTTEDLIYNQAGLRSDMFTWQGCTPGGVFSFVGKMRGLADKAGEVVRNLQ